MNFGKALKHLKKGKAVCRQGWNGKGMFLYYVGSQPLNPGNPIEEMIAGETGNTMLHQHAHIVMKTVDGGVVPWLASQTDMLADDWQQIEFVPDELFFGAMAPMGFISEALRDIFADGHQSNAAMGTKLGDPDADVGLEPETVTIKQVKAFIRGEHFFTAYEGAVGSLKTRFGLELVPECADTFEPLKLLTICVLVLDNGFTVLGTSACADPKKFDRKIGERLAREQAKQKVWELLGFQLRTKLASL